jgi:hypothetical protein
LSSPTEDGPLQARDRKADAGADAEAWERYMDSCTAYIRRQVIVYQNWPQRRWGPAGYREGKVFTDLNN